MDKQSLRSKSASRINSVVQDKRRLREDVLFFVLLSARTDLSQAAFASVCNGHAVTRFIYASPTRLRGPFMYLQLFATRWYKSR